VLHAAGLSGADVARVLHGTTIATNLILEGKGAPAALITTAGFKYVLEIGRQDVPRRASLFAWVKPKRPVAPEHIFEVGGRIGPDGAELQPLDEAAVRAAARAIRSRASARSPIVLAAQLRQHRTRAARRRHSRRGMPGALISISSEVLPVFREYERSMTTILNA
jgi:N-methylhydantoinase A